MRITGGQYSGRVIRPPRGPRVRTTLDHVRQALFSLVRERVKGAKALDLFAGSGALGLEALSRGACHVTFVDRSGFSIQAIGENLRRLSIAPRESKLVTLYRGDAAAAVRRLGAAGELFDLVLVDPPYHTPLARISLMAVSRHAIVSSSGWVVVEHDKRVSLPSSLEEAPSGRLERLTTKRYGDTALTIYERQ